MSLVSTVLCVLKKKLCFRSSSKEILLTSTEMDVWGVGWGGRRLVSTYQSVCAIRFLPSERFLADSIEADMYI